MASLGASTRDPNSVFVEGRVIGSGFYATRPIQVPSLCCATRDQLEYALRYTHEPQVIDETFIKETTAALYRHRSDFPPVFVLEETVRSAKHGAQHKAFMTVTWENAQEIKRWFERNILGGTATRLQVEIHVGWRDHVHLLLPRAAADKGPDEAWAEYTDKLRKAGLDRGISTAKFSNIPRREVPFLQDCEICHLARVAALQTAAEQMDLQTATDDMDLD